MIPIQELCKTLTYEEARKQLPTLQLDVFNCLRQLTPTILDYEFNHQDFKGFKFNQKELDSNTHSTLHTLIKQQLDNPRVILTNSDIMAAYQRVKELLFINQAKKQKLIKIVIDKDGNENLFVDNDIIVTNNKKINKLFSPNKWRTQFEIRTLES